MLLLPRSDEADGPGGYRRTIAALCVLLTAAVAPVAPVLAAEGDTFSSARELEDPSRPQGAAQGAGETAAGEDSVAAAEAPAAYTVKIEGVDDSTVRSLLESSSQLVALASKPPATQAALVRRIQGDFDRFRAVLRSEGYYDSLIDYRIDGQATPMAVTVMVDTGPTYRLQSYDVIFQGESEEEPRVPPPLSALGLRLDQRARAADVVGAEQRLLTTLADEAHPLADMTKREAIVDHNDRTMRVTVHIDPGPFTRFGPLAILGLETVREDYVRTLVPWQQGDPYDQRKVDAFRAKLIKAGLFTSVVIDRPDHLDENGELPMTLQLIEGKQRSVGVGAKYYTSEGPAGEVFWEHRNLFGRDEDLRITLELGQIRQQGTIDFTKPNWRRPDQDLLGEVKATRQTSEAFDEIGVSSVAKLRRPLSETWTGSIGTSLEWSQLKDQNGQNTSTLVGFPLEVYRDATDSLLDPRVGMRLRLEATPYLGWFDGAAHFLSGAAIVSGYQPLDRDKLYVLAGRAKIGSIVGQSRQDIPANKRFYAGGGDSVRGYEFQKIGPLDDDNDPIGGRSVVELNAELRAHVWGKFSLVPFVDGGNVYDPIYPDFSEELRWAAGIGARYDTVIGPVRFDIAFPINPPPENHDKFQFYISLGQAF